MDYRTLFVRGNVAIGEDFPFAETAAKLGRALGVKFRKDPVGTYDEFPSYSTVALGLKLVLLAAPDPKDQVIYDEPLTGYMLQISPEFRSSGISEDAKCDISDYLKEMLKEQSNLTINEL